MGEKAPKIVTVDLEEPIERADGKIEKLQLRKPSSGELRGVSMLDLVKMETSAVMAVLPRVTMPPLIDAEVAKLDPADLFACGVEISNFFMTREEKAAAFPTT
jgi:hypothetical protein